MNTHIRSTPVRELPPVVIPEEKARPQDGLLQEVSRALVTDGRTKPAEYLEEVRVTLGGE